MVGVLPEASHVQGAQGYKPAPGYNEFWNAEEWWVQ